MSLSKKSRYVPPHLRENKKDIVVVNPDDEMPPPPRRIPNHPMNRGPPPPLHAQYPPPYHGQYGPPPPQHYMNGPPPPSSYYSDDPNDHRAPPPHYRRSHSPPQSPPNGHVSPPPIANKSNGINNANNEPLDAPPNLPIMQPKPTSDSGHGDGGNVQKANHDHGDHGDHGTDAVHTAPATPPRKPMNGVGHGRGPGGDQDPFAMPPITNSSRRRYGNNSPIQDDWRSAPKLEQPELLPPPMHQNIPENSGYNGVARNYETRRHRGGPRYHSMPRRGGYGPPPPHGHPQGPPPGDFYDDEDPNEAAFKKLNSDGMDRDHNHSPFMPEEDMDYAFGGGRARGRGRGGMGRGRGRGRGRPRGSYGARGRGRRMSEFDESVELEVEMKTRGGSRRGHYRGKPVNENVDRSNGHHHQGPISPAMNSRSGGSRYNRQYVSPANRAQQQPEDDEMVMNGDELGNYKLSEDFQALNIKKPGSTRSRRRRKNAGKQENGGANTIIGTLNGNSSKKNSPKKQSPPSKKKNDKPSSKTGANANAVPLSVPKSRPAPVNWAANLKQKPAPKPQPKPVANPQSPSKPPSSKSRGASRPNSATSSHSSYVNGVASFQPHPPRKAVTNPQSPELMDSSRISADALKVQHVLEVMNMTAAEYQSVMGMFRRFGVETSALLSVKGRWFVCFDGPQSAVRAVNMVRDNRFKLRRIDCNVQDVEMLKNNVPPPMRVQPHHGPPRSEKAPPPQNMSNHRMGGGQGIERGGRDGRNAMDPRYRKQGMPHRGRGQFESQRQAANHVNGKSAVWGH